MAVIPAVCVIALFAVGAILVVNTLRFRSRQEPLAPEGALSIDPIAAAERLGAALRYVTITSDQAPPISGEALAALHRHLEISFPRVHAALHREVVAGYSLLYTWEGASSAEKPILLLAHLDVVPAEQGAELWTHPPFGGRLADGYVWGRGAMDDKGSALAILEALESLLEAGFRPSRTVYVAFGHDEEVGGARGSAITAALLRDRGVELEFVLDEGLVVTHGIVPGLEGPAALVGIAEKGNLRLDVSATGTPGHGSIPAGRTAIGLVAAALDRIERHDFRARLDGVARLTFLVAGPEMRLPYRLLFANLWLFGPLVARRLTRRPATNAILRTTAVATMVGGGEKDNVLPLEARATVDVRIKPGSSVAETVAVLREAVGDGRVTLRPRMGDAREPSAASSTSSHGYRALARAVRQVMPDAVVVPSILLPTTDSRHFLDLTKTVLRFSPIRVTADDLPRIHGVDERVAVANYAEIIRCYAQLIRNGALAAPSADEPTAGVTALRAAIPVPLPPSTRPVGSAVALPRS
jgi:carboxypeptidase PM20D1